MTTWCRVCQKRKADHHRGTYRGVCEPCAKMIRYDLAMPPEHLRDRIEATALALRRLLEANRLKPTKTLNVVDALPPVGDT